MFNKKLTAVTFALLLALGSNANGADKAEFIGTLNGHKGSINTLQFDQSGSRVLSGSQDGTACTWDIRTGRMMQRMGKSRMGISKALYSPDGNFILTTGNKNAVLVWDADSGKLFSSLKGAKGDQRCLAISPDGDFVAIGSSNASFTIWRVKDGSPIHQISAHDAAINHVVFSPDGEYLATVGEDGAIRVWEVLTGYLAFAMKADESLNCLQFDPAGHNMIVAGDNITMFNLRSGKILKKYKGHDGAVRTLAFSPNGKFFISGSDDQTAKVWSVTTGRLVDTLQHQDGPIISAAFSPDGMTIVTGSQRYQAANGKAMGDTSIAVWSAGELYSDNRITLQVERDLYHWSKKGEFEKVAAHEARMNTVHIQTGKFFTEAYRKFENDVREGASISVYDVEREEYTINLPSLGKFKLHVPLKRAKEFKKHFADVVYRNFIVEPNLQVPGGSTWELKRVELFSPAMKQSFFYGEAE